MRSVGIVQYLNSLPLIAPYLFKEFEAPFKWEFQPPKTLNQMVLDNKLEVSFVSSLFYLENQEHLELIPGIGIGADGPVGSVSLFYPEHLVHFNGVEVTFDKESKTSNGILKWYLEKIRGERPLFKAPPLEGTPSKKEPFLLIGDRCLAFGLPKGYKKIDLAEEWKSYTNLPLPFAVLAAKKGFSQNNPEEGANLRNALLTGLMWSKNNLQRLLDYGTKQIPVGREELSHYWKGLRYTFDERDETALIHLERDVLKRVQGAFV